jgi:hypothetical protein
MPRVRQAPTEGDLNDVFEIQLNFIGCQRIEKPIERLLQLFLKIFENVYDSFNSRLVYHTVRSIDEQTDIVVKFQFRWKFHGSLRGYHALFDASAREDFRRAVPTEHRAISRRLLVLEIFGL